MSAGSPLPVRPPSGALRRGLAAVMHEPAPLPALMRQPWHPWLVVGLVSIGAFIGQLDATIVQLALPTLRTTFAVRLETVSWVSLAYLVAFASTLPIFGRLCQMFGRKSLYLIGYAVFVAASALCALAPDMPSLIAFRVLQGMGGALLGANSISILVKAVDEERRGRALGFFAAAQAIGMSAGPAVGGLLLGLFGWRAVFWLSVPFGLVAVVAGWLALPRSRDTEATATFDWRGALLLGPALVCLVLALNQMAAWGLASPAILGCALLAAGLAWLLVRQEKSAAVPLVDLRLFTSRGFSFGAGAIVLGYAMLYGMFFLMSFRLEHGYGDSPFEAGLRLALIPVALGLAAPFSGGLSDRLGARVLGTAGMGACILALMILAFRVSSPDASRFVGSIAFILFGVGLGVFIAPNNHETLKAAPSVLAGQAGSLLNLMRVLGTSLGVASATTTLSWSLAAAGIADRATPVTGEALLDAVVTGLVLLAVMATLTGLLCLLRPKTEMAAP
ncbi:MFS transporter [Xanthobacter autotrophicus DSM 431]|uniref:MFS transporter n=1 Tax=Xanthobacter nonsaccharivorans TaxID=3119912 RepID=UPI003726C2CF